MLDTHSFPTPVRHSPNTNKKPLMKVQDLNLWYGDKQALFDINFDLFPSEILAFIGPSGCGKSTALKTLNRMHDETHGVTIKGLVTLDEQDIYDPDIDPPMYRKRFGWVAQKPNPFTSSLFDNVAYGARIHGLTRNRAELNDHVEDCLRRAHLWDEVKDHLHSLSGTDLSGGQQQRLCIARALATEPDILLMDEPTGSIDPIATARVERLMMDLKDQHSIVVVTHSMMEAKRVADRVAYFHMGRLLELGPTETVFEHAETKQAWQFIHGELG